MISTNSKIALYTTTLLVNATTGYLFYKEHYSSDEDDKDLSFLEKVGNSSLLTKFALCSTAVLNIASITVLGYDLCNHLSTESQTNVNNNQQNPHLETRDRKLSQEEMQDEIEIFQFSSNHRKELLDQGYEEYIQNPKDIILSPPNLKKVGSIQDSEYHIYGRNNTDKIIKSENNLDSINLTTSEKLIDAHPQIIQQSAQPIDYKLEQINLPRELDVQPLNSKYLQENIDPFAEMSDNLFD